MAGLLASGVEVIKEKAFRDNQSNLHFYSSRNLSESFPQKQILFLSVNIKNKLDLEKAFNEIKDTFGTIDIVINGAAVLNDQTVENTIEVNVLGLIYSIFAALNHMSVEKGGKGEIIVNFSSVAGLDPMFSIPVYSASKFAVTEFTASLADERLEKKFGVQFVTVCRGATDTSLIRDMRSLLISEDLFPATEEYAAGRGSQT